MRRLFAFIIAGFLLCVPFFTVHADDITGEHIVSFEQTSVVNKDGTVDITEKIAYDFGDAYRHGIFRTIPYVKKAESDRKFKFSLTNISVTNEKGKKYLYSMSLDQANVTIKIGDPDRTVTGVNTYVISYRIGGALSYFKDHDEFYWNVTGDKWNVPISSATAMITLPDSINAGQTNTACYTGSYGSTLTGCNAKADINRFVFTTKGPLSANQGLTTAVSFPKGFVAVLEPTEVVSFFSTWAGKLTIAGMILLALLWYIIYPFYLPFKWVKQGRDPKGSIGIAKAWFDPPKTAKGRQLTPGETGALIDEKADLRDILASIIHLARNGYIQIEEPKKGDFYIVRTTKKAVAADTSQSMRGRKIEHAPLLPFETKLMQALLGISDRKRVKDLHISDEIEKVKDMIYDQMVSDGFFEGNPQSIRRFYSIMLVLAIFTFNLPLIITSWIFGMNMPRKTVMGAEQSNMAKALRNFLNSQERQLEFQADKQMFFERLLPYAIAFGVEKVWFKRFESVNLKQPDWYSGYYGSNFSNYAFANSLHSSFSTITSATRPETSNSGFSSGTSGGFSGGGGGGGGGGSW